MSTNGNQTAPSRDQIITQVAYLAAVYGCDDTSEAAQKSNALTISVVDLANIPGSEQLPPGVTHQFYVMINATAYMVTRSADGYTVEPHDQTEKQRQERELRDTVLEAALWFLTGEGAGYHVGAGAEARNTALKELLEEGPEGEEPAREESDPILHPVIREHAPDLSISLAPASEDEEGPQPLRQWAVEIGPYNRCEVLFFGYNEDGTPELIPQEYEDDEDEEDEE